MSVSTEMRNYLERKRADAYWFWLFCIVAGATGALFVVAQR